MLTLFPELIEGIFSQGVVGQAKEKKLIQIDCINPRAFTEDVHKTVDDRPFGGGDGMLMLAEPLAQALKSVGGDPHVVYLSPQGKKLNDAMLREFSKKNHLVLVCGRYGGVDQRFTNEFVDEEISIGDYVLSGGELAAAVVIEATARMVPGVLGHQDSSQQDSFVNGLLEQPSFTRPRVWEHGNSREEVPSILLSGNHKLIQQWREKVAELVTLYKRPDLFFARNLPAEHFEELKRFWQGLSLQDKNVLGLKLFEFPDNFRKDGP